MDDGDLVMVSSGVVSASLQDHVLLSRPLIGLSDSINAK
jgi:hypothetical protein